MPCISINLFFSAIYLLLVSFLWGCAPVQASQWQDNLYFDGFFTLDITYSDQDLGIVGAAGTFRLYPEGEVNAKNSLVGGQLEYQFTDALSVFIQGSGFYESSDSFDTSLDWGYASYDFGDDTRVRLGKFQIPFLQGTELRKIGFSRLWARPLIPGNGASGFNDYLGVEWLKQVGSDGSFWDFQLAAGKVDHELPGIDGDNMGLLSVRYLQQNIWLRSALMQAHYSVKIPGGSTESGDVIMVSLEGEVVLGDLIINPGVSHSHSDISPDDSMYYLSLAYMLDEVTPFAFVSRLKLNFDDALTGEQASALLAQKPENIPALTILTGDIKLTNIAAGLRWSISEYLVIKAQLENINISDNVEFEGQEQVKGGNAWSLVLEGGF